MTQPTPGPWVITGSKLHGFDFAIVNPKGDAEVGDWLVAGARWEANARLIAAAPDLLEALKAANAALNHFGDVLNGMDAVSKEDELHNPAFEKVRAAIARAEGRT